MLQHMSELTEPVKKKKPAPKKTTTKKPKLEDPATQDAKLENDPKVTNFKIYNYKYKTIKLYFLDNKSLSAKLIKCEDFDIVVETIKDEKPVLLYIQKSSLKFLSFPPDDTPSEPIDYKYVPLKNLTGQEITIFFKNDAKSVTGVLKSFYTYEIILTVKVNNTPVDIMVYKAAIKYISTEIDTDVFK